MYDTTRLKLGTPLTFDLIKADPDNATCVPASSLHVALSRNP